MLLGVATFGLGGGGARAATDGTLRAEAAAIESHLAQASSALDANAEAYLAERSRYTAAAAAAGALQGHVRVVERAITADQALVRSAAVDAYVDAGASSPVGLYLLGKPDELATTSTYERAAADRITASIALLNSAKVELALAISTKQAEAALAAGALRATEASRASVLAEVNSERAVLASVNGRLAALVRSEEIARERAAAAAAAAARASAGTGPPAVVGVAPVTLTSAVPSSLAGDFAAIRRCESSDDYALDTGNGYYGAYQFAASTWTNLGGVGLASSASPAAQDAAAYRLYVSSGWGAWPACAAAAGL